LKTKGEKKEEAKTMRPATAGNITCCRFDHRSVVIFLKKRIKGKKTICANLAYATMVEITAKEPVGKREIDG